MSEEIITETNRETATDAGGGAQIQVLEGLKLCASAPACISVPQALPGLHHLVYEIVDNSIEKLWPGIAPILK